VKEATEIVVKITGDPSQAKCTWVILTEAAVGGAVVVSWHMK
jgi:hypothetical protein